MLINSVLVFLKNALPAFFLISVSASIMKPYLISMRSKITAGIVGVSGSIILSQSMSQLSSLVDGIGSELILALLHFLIFIILLLQLLLNLKSTGGTITKPYNLLFTIGVFLVITLDGASLLIYLNGFWSSQVSVNSIIIGSILGLGISLSSALLLLYILRSKLLSNWFKLPYVVFIFTTARQLSEFSLKLIQADWLPASEPLWNSSNIIQDNSELGRFLNAIVGYQTTPTLPQFIFYIIGIAIPLLIIYLTNRANPQVRL